MRSFPALLVLAALTAASCGENAPASAAGDQVARESARLNEWLDARNEEELDFSPLQKSRLGRKDDYDRLDDYSEAGEDAQLAWLRASVAELEREFDRKLLDPEAQTSYDLWRYGLERAESARRFRRRSYVFQQMNGPHTFLPTALITVHRVDEEADMVAYIARLGEIGRALEQSLARAELAATSYMVGMLKILELRERAQQALGDAFDIRRFHDVVLGGGGLPLSILEQRVDDWIANESR